MDSTVIKKIAFDLGADLCGIASVERFDKAPAGYHPKDLFPDVRSMIVFAKRLPHSLFMTDSPIPYSVMNECVAKEVIRLSYELSLKLEDLQITALPVPSDPYDYWDSETMTGKGLISFRHAAVMAGIGVIGKNGILNNPVYGNLIKLGVVLLNVKLDSDPLIEDSFCPEHCDLCIQHCPSEALGPEPVKQKNCRLYSETSTKKGASITSCYNCRKVCPSWNGWKVSG
jgi:epoxyqueuosine reductase QueG